MLEAMVEQLVGLADSASEHLRNTNFAFFEGVAHIANPTLQDLRGLQILRVLTVRDFLELDNRS